MKIKKSILRTIIREEAGHLVEGCPVDLPCPYAMADELKASGASPEEMLTWVATLTQELVAPGGETGADAEGVLSTLDVVSDPVSEDMLTGQLGELEQFQWLVRAHIESSSGELKN